MSKAKIITRTLCNTCNRVNSFTGINRDGDPFCRRCGVVN